MSDNVEYNLTFLGLNYIIIHMKNNFASIKKFFVLFVIIMLSTFLFQEGAFSLYKTVVSAQDTQSEIVNDDNYQNKVENLAQNVGFSESYESFYEQGQQVTLYNFVTLIRFQNEAESIDTVHSTLNMTYVEILEEMYNAEDNYSVNKYYKTVSNNMLNLVTIFVTQTESLQISKPRSDYGKASANGGVGYSSGTILGVLPVSYVLEYEMLDQIYYNAITTTINTPTYRELCDYNNDGLIDSLSIMLLPDPNDGTSSEVIVEWSDLLWPHASQVQMSIIESYGWAAGFLGYSLNVNHFKYTYNFKTYSAGNYMLSDVNFDFISSISSLPRNTTFTHELGHVLGWPDYYVYSGADYGETAPTNTVPVGIWEIMAGSSFDLPQYPTTYSRDIQGWLGEQGVVEITENGQYTLKQVNYEEVFGVSYNGRTIAYKITNPNNPNQSIWFEYRKQVSNTFEQNSAYVTNGLLVYRVDEGFGGIVISGYGNEMLKNAGNFAAAPYNLYIFRNDVVGYDDSGDLQRATLNMGNQSMGDDSTYVVGGKTCNTTNLTWQIYEGDVNTPQNQINHSDVTYEDSGMVVRIVSINEQTGEITFEVEYAPLNPNILSANDFGDYNLYTKLLELTGKEIGDDLLVNDLENLTTLDFQNCSLSSISGLELMQLQNLQTLNLNNNNLNNINELTTFLANNPNVVISLIKNKFNLANLSSENLQSSHFIWGMQLIYDVNYYKFNDLTFQVVYFWQNSYQAYFDMSLNGNSMQTSSTLQYYTFSSYGKYQFSFEANELSGFSTDQQDLSVTIIGATLPSSQVQRNAQFPNVTISGVLLSELNISVTSVNTNIISQNNYVTWTISPKAKPTVFYTISGYFDIVDTQAPVVTLESETPLEMVIGETLILPTTEIYITDNGENVNYDFIENPEPTDISYWSKEYYSIEDGNYVFLESDFSSQDFGEYAIGYYAVDDYGNVSAVVYRHVTITGIIVVQNKFSSNLYQAILSLTGKTQVYENSLYQYSYIDFSNLGITNFNGLELLMYQDGAIIDLSNNKITLMRKMADLLANSNVALVNLNFNNLISQTETFETNPRYLLGIQGLTREVYLYQMDIAPLGVINRVTFYNYNDYQSYYTLATNANVVAGNNSIENFGTYTFTFNSLGALNYASKTIKYGNIYAISNSVTYEVFNNVSVYDLYNVEGLETGDVDFEYKIGMQTFLPEQTFGNSIGSFNININVWCDNELLKTLFIMLSINDLTPPTINILGNEVVYLLLGDEYIENGYTAQDNYDLEPDVETDGEVDSNTAGVYYITYRANDQTFNYSQTQTRTIYVGNVTPKSNVKVDVKTRVSELDMFNYVTFSKSDFNVTVEGEPYDELTIGTYTIEIILTHKNDANLVIELVNTIKVVDRISPVIQLNGNSVVYIVVGTHYIDSGARVNDNYDDLKYISSINSLNTSLVGVYTLTYQAQDASGNVATPVTRIVNVIYKAFNSLNVVLVSGVNGLYINNLIRFKANITNYDPNQYNYNATFIWYVDGVEVQSAKDIYCQTTFDSVGIHQLEVKVLNMNAEGGYTITDGEIFQIQITEGGFLEKYGIPIIITTSVVIVLAVIYSLFLRKKRKFYF